MCDHWLKLRTLKIIDVMKYCRGVSVNEWLKSLSQNHLPLTPMGSNPARHIGFFHMMKLTS